MKRIGGGGGCRFGSSPRPRNFPSTSKFDWGIGEGKGRELIGNTHLEKQSSLSEGDAGRRLVPYIFQLEYADLCYNSQDLRAMRR